MKNIVFIHPPWSYVYGNYSEAARAGNLYPPLGICYLKSYIDKYKPEYNVQLIDAEVEELSVEDVADKVKQLNPFLVGFTCSTPIFNQTKKLAGLIKKNINGKIVLGGSHATVLKEKVLEENDEFDYLIYGEGEKTIIELLEFLENKFEINKIKGLIYKSENKIIDNGSRDLLDKLDEVPFPARDGLKFEKYLWSVPTKGIVPFTTIMTTRGCPFSCIFCSARTVFGRKVRQREINKVIDEMEVIIKNFNIKHFSFIDDTFTLYKDRVLDLCNEIINRKLNITFEGFTRANTVDEEIISKLKEAGMVRISFGIESGNSDMLKKIKKGITLDDIRKAFKLAKKYGLETKGSAIIGFPYETKKTMMDTINFVSSIKECDQVYLNICTPYPGTELYDMVMNGEGGIKLLTKDFSKYMRYGNPVIEVNDLTKKDLIKYQKYGFRKFYFTPYRIWYNLKRAGFKAGFKNAWAFLKGIFK